MISYIASNAYTGVARGVIYAAYRESVTFWGYLEKAMMTDDGPFSENIFKHMDARVFETESENGWYDPVDGPSWLANIYISNLTLILYTSKSEETDFDEVVAACQKLKHPYIKYQIDISGNLAKQTSEIHDALVKTGIPKIHLHVLGTCEPRCHGIENITKDIFIALFLKDSKTYSRYTMRMQPNRLDHYIEVPQSLRYFLPYKLRKINETFYKEFWQSEKFANWPEAQKRSNKHICREGKFKKSYYAEDHFHVEFTVIVDNNERLLSFDMSAVRTYYTGRDDPRPGSDHLEIKFERRQLTVEEIKGLKAVLDRCTNPRAPKITEMICSAAKKSIKDIEVNIDGDFIVFKGAQIGLRKIKLCHFYEFVEYSFSYLECFTCIRFVQANFTELVGIASWAMSILRLSDPRRIYNFAEVFESYWSRLINICRLSDAYQGVECFNKDKDEYKMKIMKNLNNLWGIEYVEGI